MGKTRIKVVSEVEKIQTEPQETSTSEIKSVKGKVESSKKRSKKYQEVSKDLDRTKSYSLDEAIDMVKKMSYAKFNATIEAHINTAQTGLRGFLKLPYAAGKTEYKTETKAPVIHLALGKLDQPTEEIGANVKILLSTLGKTKIKKVSLAPTMGPSIKVDLTSI